MSISVLGRGLNLARRPGLAEAVRCPVFLVVLVASAAISGWSWAGHSIDALVAGPGSIGAWKLLTSVLPHGSVPHLVLNLYWWWMFGVALERAWGSVRFLGAVALLAVFSGLAEAAVGASGIGLSGVVYGLCTLLVVVGERDERLRGLVTRNTVVLFAIWFIACVVMTARGEWNIGNAAHAGGAVGGVLLGCWAVAWRAPRWVWAGAVCVGIAVCWSGARFGPIRMPAGVTGPASASARAYDALAANRNDEAATLLAGVVRETPTDAVAWHNYAVALQRLGRREEAAAAYQRCVALRPGSRAEVAPSITGLLAEESRAASERGHWELSLSLAGEALGWSRGGDPRLEAHCLFIQGIGQQQLDRPADALASYKDAVRLDATLRENVAPAVASILDQMAADAAKREEYALAVRLSEEALGWSPDDRYAGRMLEWLMAREGPGVGAGPE